MTSSSRGVGGESFDFVDVDSFMGQHCQALNLFLLSACFISIAPFDTAHASNRPLGDVKIYYRRNLIIGACDLL